MRKYAIVIDRIKTSVGETTEVRDIVEAVDCHLTDAGDLRFENGPRSLVVAYAKGNWIKVSVLPVVVSNLPEASPHSYGSRPADSPIDNWNGHT